MDEIKFFVAGEPVPQGSTKSFYIKKIEKVVTTHGNKSTGVWRQRIATEAQRAQMSDYFFSADRKYAYSITLIFKFTKPKSIPKKVIYNTKRPDIDKLIRAVLDGITNVLIPDDSLVVAITSKKEYAGENETPGLMVSLTRLNP